MNEFENNVNMDVMDVEPTDIIIVEDEPTGLSTGAKLGIAALVTTVIGGVVILGKKIFDKRKAKKEASLVEDAGKDDSEDIE